MTVGVEFKRSLRVRQQNWAIRDRGRAARKREWVKKVSSIHSLDKQLEGSRFWREDTGFHSGFMVTSE